MNHMCISKLICPARQWTHNSFSGPFEKNSTPIFFSVSEFSTFLLTFHRWPLLLMQRKDINKQEFLTFPLLHYKCFFISTIFSTIILCYRLNYVPPPPYWKKKSSILKLKSYPQGISLVAQWIKDPVFSVLCLWLQLWLGFDPWPGNSHMAKKKEILIPSTSECDLICR